MTWKNWFYILLLAPILVLSVHTALALAPDPTTMTAALPAYPDGNWLALLSGPVRARLSPRYDTDRALYALHDHRLLRSYDAGATWQTLYTAPALGALAPGAPAPLKDGETVTETERLLALAVSDDVSPTLFLIQQDAVTTYAVLRSQDGGATWSQALTSTTTLYDVAAVRDTAGRELVFAVGGERVWRSIDGGDTWAPAETGLPAALEIQRIFTAPDFSTHGVLYLTGFGPMARSTDGGETWTPVSIPWVDVARDVVFSPYYATDGTLWVSYYFIEGSGVEELPPNGIVRSTDYGATWQKVNEGLPVDYFDGAIMGLAVAPPTPETGPGDLTLYAVQRTVAHDGMPWRLYRSIDGGLHWREQEETPGGAPRGLLAAAPDLLILPTSEGLWRRHSPCWNWIVNGGFERDAGWTMPLTPAQAAYTTTLAHQGTRAMQVGILTGTNRYAYSSAYQELALPITPVSATLTFWLYPVSDEVQMAAANAALSGVLPANTPAEAPAGDAQYVLVMQGDVIRERLLWTLRDTATWESYTLDLGTTLGEPIRLLFGVYNDGAGGTTGMAVDDVALTLCDAPSPLPQPTPTPSPTPAPPSPPPTPEDNVFVLGEDFLVTDATGHQMRPNAAFNTNDDTYLVVWQDTRAKPRPDIYAQRAGAAGRLLGNARLITDDDAVQSNPRIAYLATADRYLVIWEDKRTPLAGDDVWGRLVNGDGVPQGVDFPIATGTGSQLGARVVASESAGTFLVIYDEGGAGPVRGQRVGNDGTLIGSPFDISGAAAEPYMPDVSRTARDGAHLVVWKDARDGWPRIYGQWVQGDGALVGDNVAISTGTAYADMPTAAVGAGDGMALVVWLDERAGTGAWDVYGRLLDASGVVTGTDLALSTGGGAGTPVVAAWPDSAQDEFLVVWQADTGAGDLHARRVIAPDSDGAPADVGEGLLVSAAQETQAMPAIVAAPSATAPAYLVVWEDYRAHASGIYGQRLDRNGQPLDLHVGLSPMDDMQTLPAVAYSAASDVYLVAWPNFVGGGNASAHVRAQIVTGALYDPLPPPQAGKILTLTDRMLEWGGPVDVAWDETNDRFLVVWADPGHHPYLQDYNLVGRLVAADGITVSEILTIANAPGHQQQPAVAFEPAQQRYLVVFEHTEDGRTETRAQILDFNGTPRVSATDVNLTVTTVTSGMIHQAPDVACDGVGPTCLVVWQEQISNDQTQTLAPQGGIPANLYGQRIDVTTGSPVSPTFVVAAEPDHSQTLPVLAPTGRAGAYMVTWQDTPLARTDTDVLVRWVAAETSALGPMHAVAATPGVAEGRPSVAYHAAAGRFLALWFAEEQGAEPFTPDIYARQLDADGRPQGPTWSVAVSNHSGRTLYIICILR